MVKILQTEEQMALVDLLSEVASGHHNHEVQQRATEAVEFLRPKRQGRKKNSSAEENS
jgi:hypothetical protein